MRPADRRSKFGAVGNVPGLHKPLLASCAGQSTVVPRSVLQLVRCNLHNHSIDGIGNQSRTSTSARGGQRLLVSLPEPMKWRREHRPGRNSHSKVLAGRADLPLSYCSNGYISGLPGKLDASCLNNLDIPPDHTPGSGAWQPPTTRRVSVWSFRGDLHSA